MRPSSGYRRLLRSLLVLASITHGGFATIDNAVTTGAVRENSLPRAGPGDLLSSVGPSNFTEIDQSSSTTIPAAKIDTTITATTTTTTTTTAATAVVTTTSTAAEVARPTAAPIPTNTDSPVSTTSEKTTSTSVSTKVAVPAVVHEELPQNCLEFNASTIQLMYSEKARIRKCCPPGQMIRPRSDFRYECVPGSQELKIETVVAHFYGNNECIEVSEEQITLPVEANDQCEDATDALMYSADQGDDMYVLQNGSLLVLEFGSLVSVFESYCVEMTSDAQLLAKVCSPAANRAWAKLIIAGVTMATMMLLFSALCYSFVPKLNNTFGYLIAGHAGTFAIGTIFLGLARCGDRCISAGSIGITEMFVNAMLGSSVFLFFLMNVFNTLYVAYYIPNGLEYDNKNKREMYAFVAVLYTITLIPLFLLPRGSLICMVFIYYGAILVTHALSLRYTRRLTTGIYLHIDDRASGQTKINQARLNDISEQKCLCLMETVVSIVCWIVFTVLTVHFETSAVAQVCAVYSVVLQGLFIGAVYIGGRQRWTIIRECWSNSGSVDLRAVENGIEMKPLQRKVLNGDGQTAEEIH